MPRILNNPFSKILRWYYVGPRVPSKFRIWQWIRRLTGYPRLLIPYADKGWITVDDQDYLQRMIFAHGDYEGEVWTALQAFAGEDEIVWDVGANIGSFAIRALLDSRVREVHCFEPHPELVEILRTNLHLNTGNSCVHAIGLSDKIEQITLHYGPKANSGMASLEQDLGFGQSTVSCLTADEMIRRDQAPAPTLIKLDVEGWEEKVLLGATHLLKRSPPKAIVFEAACTHAGEILNKELLVFLDQYGYRVTWIKRPSGEAQPRENFLACLQADFLV